MERKSEISQGPTRGVIPFEPNIVLNREISKTSLTIGSKKMVNNINLMSNHIILAMILMIAHEKYVQLYIFNKGLILFNETFQIFLNMYYQYCDLTQ